MTQYLIVCFVATLLVPLSGYHGFGGSAEIIAAGMALPSAVALLIPLCWRSDTPPNRSPAPLMIYPLVALAVGRSLALLINQPSDPFSSPRTMAAWAGIGAFYVARRDPDRIPGAIRTLAYFLVSLALIQAGPGLQGAFINRNVIGGLLAMCLAAFLPEINSKIPERRGKNIFGVVLVIAGIIVTGSRGGMMAAAVTVAMYYGWFLRTLPVMAVSVPFLLQIRNPNALSIRLSFWLDGIYTWLNHPLFGIGPQHLPCGAGHAHNIFLSILVWSGLVGLGLMIWGIWKSKSSWIRLPAWALASLAGFIAQGIVDDLTPFPLVMVICGCLLGLDENPKINFDKTSKNTSNQ